MLPLVAITLSALIAGGVDARAIKRSERRLAYEYAWPDLARPLPHLKARMEREALAEHGRAKREAAETWARERAESGEDPPRHSYEKSWNVAGTSARLLSLSAAKRTYTGGAHEGMAYDSLIWDRKADRGLTLPALFTRPAAAMAALQKAYCGQLQADQRERRGEDFAEAEFRCPPIADAPVALIGEGRISGFEVLLHPYAAGSWAEGPYEVEVRFTPAMLRLVRPEFRAAFVR
jgi:hypothetical protein